jgi:5-methylcytosine-specific restriction endonuclease McrA
MYKVEKILNSEFVCEVCGYDAQTFFPNRPIKQLAGLFDVDHIMSDKKHTLDGEQPENYQLLCKQCHILKSYDSGDFISKNNRK